MKVKRFLMTASFFLLAGSLIAATTTGEIQSRILDEATIQNLKIQTSDGTVFLQGEARLLKDKLRAEKIVRDEMQTEVVNNISVEPSLRSDEEISVDVAAQIGKDVSRRLIFDTLSVETRDGNVILTGVVREPYLRDEAEEAASNVSGVRSVTNQIEVLSPSITDDRLRVAILRTLFRDGRLTNYLNGAHPSVNIIVNHGRVVLVGYVNSNVERTVAGTLVRQMPGVLNVDNRLIVD